MLEWSLGVCGIMDRLRKILLALMAALLYVLAWPFVALFHKKKDAVEEEHLTIEEKEKRQYRRVIIFVIFLIVFTLVSVLLQPNTKELFSKTKTAKEFDKNATKFGDMIKAKDKSDKGKDGEQGEEDKEAAAKEVVEDLLQSGDGEGEGEESSAKGQGGSEKGPAQGGKAGAAVGKGKPGGGAAGAATPGEGGGAGAGAAEPGVAQQQGRAGQPARDGRRRPRELGDSRQESRVEKAGEPPPPLAPAGPPVVLREVRVGNTESNERRVFAEVVNQSGDSLKNIEVVIKFLNYEKETVHERQVNALVVSGGLFGDSVTPLKMGEVRNFSVGIDDLPPGWSGNVEAMVKTYE